MELVVHLLSVWIDLPFNLVSWLWYQADQQRVNWLNDVHVHLLPALCFMETVGSSRQNLEVRNWES
jgi:hypothetical protein